MKHKPYTAKTLSGAQAYARQRDNVIRQVMGTLERVGKERDRYKRERRILAQFAAQNCIAHPLSIEDARVLRDRILRDECGLNPDGSPVAGKVTVNP